jgi:alpha-glucoside transport system substrate-binding protein
MAMVKPFEERTGTRVLFTSTRDLVGATRRAIDAGDPPDVVGLPNPAEMARLARQGYLHDLSGAIDVDAYKQATPPALVQLGTVDDRLVGVFVKASVKGLIWYDPQAYRLAIPDTWDELMSEDHGQTPSTKVWCAGFGSGAASGWPGTDWIEDIVLRQSGPGVYDAWVAGEQRWSSPEIRRAFRTFGLVVAPSAVDGGDAGVAASSFETAGDPLFGRPPGCLFLHQGSFMPAFFPSGSVAGRDYDFFRFPTMNPRYAGSVIGGGDIFGILRDTPQAQALLRYLVTPEAQSILVALGGSLSANAGVTDYPDAVSRRMADVLIGASLFRFDASDLMPDAMSAAFERAVLAFTRDQSRLDSLLADLDKVASDAYRE